MNSDTWSAVAESPTDNGRLVSYSLPAPGVTAVAFLSQAKGQERFFWEDVRDNTTFAGFGVAANLFAWGESRYDHINQQAHALFDSAIMLADAPEVAKPRLFGGFAFRDDFVPDNTWAAFHPAHFILPHYQLVQIGGDSWLTINALIPADENPQAVLPELREALAARHNWLRKMADSVSVSPSVTSKERPSPTYPMSPDEWAQLINQARDTIATNELKKVVLSRVCELRFVTDVDVDGALSFLNDKYADCYRFLFEPRPHHAFYGATPELLAKVNGRTLTTMALAGSIQRGQTAHEDEELGQQLLNSAKDRHEHDVVVVSILGRLADITRKLEIAPQPGVYKLSNIQHLFTPIRAELADPQGILPLVKALHPTPALGGSPRHRAMQFIQATEPITRGWYGGPVGWIDYKLDGAFAVGIRSAVAQERRAWLYAGAGIVADSIPEKEWAETGLKFQPMLNALGIA